MDVAKLADQLHPTPQDLGSNPYIGNFIEQSFCPFSTNRSKHL